MLFDGEDEDPQPMPLGNQHNVLESDSARIVVNAEAGTGKTTTMRMKIEQVIEEDGAHADDILVLTFANKAAHEIENRLARTLPREGHDIDSYTYHSFCHSLIQDYAYHLGLPPDFITVTEDRRRTVVQAIMDEMEHEFVEPIDPTSGYADHEVARDLLVFISELKHRGFEPDDVRRELPTRSTLRSLFAINRRLETDAERLFDVDDDLDGSNAPTVFSQRADTFRETIRTELDGLSESATTDAGHEVTEEVGEYLANWLVVLNLLEADFEANHPTTARVHLPAILFGADYPTYYAEPKQDLLSRLEAYLQMLGKAHVYVDGFEAYERYLADELQAVDFDDLIKNARYLLTESPHSEDILRQWEYVFCDEFQDTDAGQIQLVEALARDKDLFVIGDRHQAIYEWRGANPDNIETIQSVLDGVESIDLDLNFRSPQGILDFAANMPGERDRLDTDDPPVERTRMEADKDDIDPCVLKVSDVPENDVQDSAHRVAITASKLLTGQIDDVEQYGPGDISVLVRKKYQAQAVADAFDDESIPYALPDSAGKGTSHGVQTVLSYLKLLVDPDDDVLLNRVLLMLYRVPRADLARLNRGTRPSYARLRDADLAEFRTPDRLEQARSDIAHLRECRETYSISELYQEFKDRTKVEWFLTEDERHDLTELERLISVFDEDDPLQSTLTEEFIRHLEIQESISQEEIGGPDTAEKAENRVNIMTVFQAKGLDFPVVVLPFLSDDDWLQGAKQYLGGMHEFDLFGEILDDTVENPLLYDDANRELPEQHRILHVGITRASERLVVMGNEPETRDFTPDDLDRFLPGRIDWSTAGAQMRIWDGITDAYDRTADRSATTVADISELIDFGIDETPENLTYYGDIIDVESAVDEVLGFARNLRDGTIDVEPPSSIGIASTTRVAGGDRVLGQGHSYTSLDTFSNCPRRHVLDHVVGAYSDPRFPVETGPQRQPGVSPRKVGDLFHYIAEESYWRNYAFDRDAWYRASRRLGYLHDIDDATVEATQQCIDAYFDSVAQDWSLEAVEVPFEFHTADLDIDVSVDVELIGKIDALYRDGDGNLIVIDYKTTDDEHVIEDSYQLGLYTVAADRLYGLQPWQAGYLVLGKESPEAVLFEEAELRSMAGRLADDIQAATTQSVREQYADPQNGRHCTHCDHTSLGCGIPELYE